MKFIQYIYMVAGAMFFNACSDRLENEVQQEQAGIYTLSGKIEDSSAMSRAQIELGGKTNNESFLWNEGDAFSLYQYLDSNVRESVFEINSNYSESNTSDKKTAVFRTTTSALSKLDYVAFYPSGLHMQNSSASMEFDMELDFSNVTDPNEVWSQYLQENMFMMADGTLSDTGANVVSFKHLCSMARISYTNETNNEVAIDAIRLGSSNGNICYLYHQEYELGENQYWFDRWGMSNYWISTRGLKVAAGETADFYILFFPTPFEEDDVMEISLQQSSQNHTVSLPVSKIAAANGGKCEFEAGKRYWFQVSDSKNGLVWSKDFTAETVTIPNPELSLALQRELGEDWVTLNESGYAVMNLMDVRSITELDFSWKDYTITTLAGIELFENLQILECAYTQLVECDLSQNTQLKKVNLAYNKLTSLDLNENQALRWLRCDGNKDLNTLLVGNCSNLYNINFAGTSVSSITIPNKENITGLGYNPTKMSLDFTAYPNLVDLCVDGSELSSVDFIPDFAKEKLSSLSIANNKVSTLDLTLYSNLQQLFCVGNNLTTLDLTAVKNLVTLDCKNNFLESLNIKPLTALNHLECGIQKENKILILKATMSQQEKWNNIWKHYEINEGVYLEGEYSNNQIVFSNKLLSQALYGVLGDDKVSLNSDGSAVMNEMDVLAVKQLDFGWEKYFIKSLNGIEHFANLEYLRCEQAGLLSCDLTQNTKLQEVHLSNNELTSLDFSHCPDLHTLICSHMSGLTSLNIDGCTKLNNLQAQGTGITSLNISNPDALQNFLLPSGLSVDLSIFDNLTGLGLTDRGLEYLDIIPTEMKRRLSFLKVDNNNLTSINLSEFPNLGNLSCAVNKITQLDLSAVPYLKDLDVCENQILTLDISSLSLLEWLYCGRQNSGYLVLSLTDEQKILWNERWKSINSNQDVYLEGENTTDNNTSGNDFPIGGNY